MGNLLMYSSYDDLACTLSGAAIVGIIVGIVINLLLCHAAGRMAEGKGHGYWGYWWLTFFFGILGLIIAACVSDTKKEPTIQNVYNNYGETHETKWVCAKCGNENEQSSHFCTECGKERDRRWTCSQCGNMNSEGNKFCGQCGALKGEPEKEEPFEEVEQKNWTCSSCSTINDVNNKFCSQCGKAKE